MILLEAKEISKSFIHPQKVKILDPLSLSVSEGETIAITGRSGEGKSTLLHILGTLEQPDTGTITIQGTLVTPSSAPFLRTHAIGFVFQAFHLLEDLSTLENVLMPARIARKKIDLEYGRHLLSQVGLLDRALLPAKFLSGGEKQRLAIGRALCNDPPLIFADEISGNLDAANAKEVTSLLFSLVRQKQKGLVLVTHDLALANLCDRQYSLSNGLLIPRLQLV